MIVGFYIAPIIGHPLSVSEEYQKQDNINEYILSFSFLFDFLLELDQRKKMRMKIFTIPIGHKVKQMKLFIHFLTLHSCCWGPSASEGPQKHDLTVFLECNV